MITIAITIDEETVAALDELAATSGDKRPNRSALVRKALAEYLENRKKRAREERERKVFAQHRELLSRQAEALVAEQATS